MPLNKGSCFRISKNKNNILRIERKKKKRGNIEKVVNTRNKTI